MIFGKHKIQYDEGKVEIKQVNPKTKEKELKATGYAWDIVKLIWPKGFSALLGWFGFKVCYILFNNNCLVAGF